MEYVTRKEKEGILMAIKFNDVRILRNIIGDKYDDGDDLPKYTPKKLNWDKWTQNREEQKLKIIDLTKLDKPVYKGGAGLDLSPKAFNPQAQAEATLGAKEVLSGWREEAAGEREAKFAKEQARYARQKEIQEGIDIAAERKRQDKESERIRKFNEAQSEAEIRSSQREEKARRAGSVEKERIAAEEKDRERQYKSDKLAFDKLKLEKSAPRLLAEEERLGLKEQSEARRQWEKDQIQRRKDEADAGLIRYEQSIFGQFLGPKSRFVQTSGRVAENIGQNLGGSILGPFSDPGASKSLSNAITSRNAYIELVKQRYRSKKPPQTLTGASDIMAIGTAGERKRLTELNRAVERSQSVAQTTGFMGGTSGQFMIGRARQQSSPNLYPFTQIGARGGNLGTFGPEALSRMGVTQSLTSIHPATKWDTIFSRGTTPEATDRISFLLGKTPDSGAMAKLKRFL
jgi:hypothetical protein